MVYKLNLFYLLNLFYFSPFTLWYKVYLQLNLFYNGVQLENGVYYHLPYFNKTLINFYFPFPFSIPRIRASVFYLINKKTALLALSCYGIGLFSPVFHNPNISKRPNKLLTIEINGCNQDKETQMSIIKPIDHITIGKSSLYRSQDQIRPNPTQASSQILGHPRKWCIWLHVMS